MRPLLLAAICIAVGVLHGAWLGWWLHARVYGRADRRQRQALFTQLVGDLRQRDHGWITWRAEAEREWR